jgi:hypothetical protein
MVLSFFVGHNRPHLVDAAIIEVWITVLSQVTQARIGSESPQKRALDRAIPLPVTAISDKPPYAFAICGVN